MFRGAIRCDQLLRRGPVVRGRSGMRGPDSAAVMAHGWPGRRSSRGWLGPGDPARCDRKAVDRRRVLWLLLLLGMGLPKGARADRRELYALVGYQAGVGRVGAPVGGDAAMTGYAGAV